MKNLLRFSFICEGLIIFCFAACHSSDSGDNNTENILKKTPFATLTDSIKRFPGNAMLYFERAELLTQNNFHEIARSDYIKCWELQKDPQIALKYASNLSILGNEKELLHFLQNCIALFPQEMEFKRLLGEAYVQSGDIRQGIALYDSLLKNDSSDFEAWFEKGRLLAQAKDTAAAILSLQKAYSLQPVNTFALELAHLYAETKNPKAVTICDTVLSGDSTRSLIDPFFIKGIYYSNLVQYEKAIIAFDSCISRDWKFTDAYIEKGIALYKQKNYDAAMNIFRIAATVSNTDPDAYFWIGRCYETINKLQQAAEYYQRAVELDKDFPEAREALKRVEKLID
ncbi:MAG TPA: tetratricopeptide repeat protein [Puia sp.]|nr:tetratricopeptide repeat protein [Puia sp.]